jgi:hypothetical protein
MSKQINLVDLANELLRGMIPPKAEPVKPDCCHNCLWAGAECQSGARFKYVNLHGCNCAAWMYYD